MGNKTIKRCRESNNLSKKVMSQLLGVTVGEYEQFERYEKEMSVVQGKDFSYYTKTPIDEIIFFAN